jgi:hypothetical protein
MVDEDIVVALGFVIIEGAYPPQIVRLFRRKEAEAISVFFPIMSLLGRVLIMTQTIATGERAMSIGLLAGIALRAILVSQVLYYRSVRRGWFRRR